MTYLVYNAMGEEFDQSEVPIERLSDLLVELDTAADAEHPDISMQSSEWALSCHKNGTVRLESLSGRDSWYLPAQSRSDMLRLLKEFATGGETALQSEPWIKGNPPRELR